ncbi:hypothetical protein QBC34DRAFT_385135 [Podospora aff. communis PSN243]|uniref:Heterokaryon incompatibility domain-containing protein n=1 Tax=Podospora aff. communis PSN243 TaxID=3040156 RepID=A0AAV9G7R2_9PEZI|nr:hypothetical protein QBC34DRAFT_385135 [Podospora aff. communis PSN243]
MLAVAANQRSNIAIPHLDKLGIFACCTSCLNGRSESIASSATLLEYPLLGSPQRTHLYEALSYTWGADVRNKNIFIDGLPLPVTDNLHEALLFLRDRELTRVIWVDAPSEPRRGLARICKRPDEQVFDTLTLAAENGSLAKTASIHDNARIRGAVAEFFKRPWFERIWVVQEIAAARSIIVQCGTNTIDGHTFSLALDSNALEPIYRVSPELQSLLRPVAFLMGRATFRQRKPEVHRSESTAAKSLGIRPLGQLLDMYHCRKASLLHDKIFALLGMSSDSPTPDLPVDYSVTWGDLFHQLVRLILGQEVLIRTAAHSQRARIQGTGAVLGKVRWAKYNNQHDQQQVLVVLRDGNGSLGPEVTWTLPPSAKPILAGDLVCLLQGAAKASIIRHYQDFFLVIMIEAGGQQRSLAKFQRSFSLVWDWEEVGDEALGFDDGTTDYRPEANTRLWATVSILQDGKDFGTASWLLRSMRKALADADVPEHDPRALQVKYRLGTIYLQAKEWDKAKVLLRQMMAVQARSQGAHHPDTIKTRKRLASAYKGQGHQSPGMLKAILAILTKCHLGKKTVSVIVESLDREAVHLLLDVNGKDIEITENLLIAAAQNELNGAEVMSLLLDRGGPDVEVTEKVAVAAAQNRRQRDKLMEILLGQLEEAGQAESSLVFPAREAQQGEEGEAMKPLRKGYTARGRLSRWIPQAWVVGQTTSNSVENERGLILEILQPPAKHWELIHGEPMADVVAVYGTCSDVYKTWTHQDPWARKTLWLNDLLMERDHSLRDLAEDFLLMLVAKRKTCPGRPIIFIGQCFGGLVIKKLMVLARNTNSFKADIFKSTRQIIFCSTPHRGFHRSMAETKFKQHAGQHYATSMSKNSLEELSTDFFI